MKRFLVTTSLMVIAVQTQAQAKAPLQQAPSPAPSATSTAAAMPGPSGMPSTSANSTPSAALPEAQTMSALTTPTGNAATTEAPISSEVAAQEGEGAAGGTTGDIVVTAQRRSQRLQEVPITIQALGAEQIAQRGIDNLGRLTSIVPGVNLSRFSTQRPLLYIRGVGTRTTGLGAEQSIGVFLDDFYVGDASAVYNNLSDVERIEVLKGPQGTLYGRNTIGGAISIVTKEPTDETHVTAQASIGNYNLVGGKASVSGALFENVLAGRLSFYSEKRDGYIRNPQTGGTGLGIDQTGVRGELRAQSGDVTIRTTADYNRDTSPGQLGKNLEPGVLFRDTTIPLPTVDPEPFRQGNPRDPRVNAENYGVTMRVAWDPGSISLLSLSQARALDFHNTLDISQSDLNVMRRDERQTSRYWSQELRASSTGGGFATFDDHVQWVAGLFYYHQNSRARDFYTFFPQSYQFQVAGRTVTNLYSLDVNTRSFAAYTDVTGHILPTLDLTVGLRYSNDRKDGRVAGIANINGLPGVARPFDLPTRLRNHSLDPKVTLSWKPADDILLYASYSSGYKSGGFQYLNGNAALANQVFGPERVDYYEAGAKTQWFNRRLTVNVAGFHGDYTGLQLARIVQAGTFVDNAASVNLNGIETEATINIFRNASLNASYTYLNNKYESYNQCSAAITTNCADLSGTPILRSPKHEVHLGGQYEVPMGNDSEITLRADWTYRSRYLLENGGLGGVLNGVRRDSLNPRWVEPGNDIFDLRVTYRTGRWSLAAWSTNLNNETIRSIISNYAPIITPLGDIGNTITAYYEPPRMYGLTLGFRY